MIMKKGTNEMNKEYLLGYCNEHYPRHEVYMLDNGYVHPMCAGVELDTITVTQESDTSENLTHTQ